MTYDPYASRGIGPHGSEYPDVAPQRPASPSWDGVYAQSGTPAHGQEVPAHGMPASQGSPEWQPAQPAASRAADDAPVAPQAQPIFGPPGPQSVTPGYGTTPQQPSYGNYGAPQPMPMQGAFGPGPVAPQGNYPLAPVQPDALYSSIQLNYWISAFIPVAAVVFYFVDKGKTPLADAHLKEVLNLAIVRMAVGILTMIPYVGIVTALVSLVLLVIGIIGASKGTEAYRNGQGYQYPFNLRTVS